MGLYWEYLQYGLQIGSLFLLFCLIRFHFLSLGIFFDAFAIWSVEFFILLGNVLIDMEIIEFLFVVTIVDDTQFS